MNPASRRILRAKVLRLHAADHIDPAAVHFPEPGDLRQISGGIQPVFRIKPCVRMARHTDPFKSEPDCLLHHFLCGILPVTESAVRMIIIQKLHLSVLFVRSLSVFPSFQFRKVSTFLFSGTVLRRLSPHFRVSGPGSLRRKFHMKIRVKAGIRASVAGRPVLFYPDEDRVRITVRLHGYNVLKMSAGLSLQPQFLP